MTVVVVVHFSVMLLSVQCVVLIKSVIESFEFRLLVL